MERKKHLLIVLMIMGTSIVTSSQYRTRIYEAYASGDMKQWKELIHEMDRSNNQQSAFVLELINYQYGYIGWCLGTSRKEEAKYWMEKMEKNMELLEKRKYQPATIEAYRAALIGYKIGLNRARAPFIGGRSIEHAKEAIRLDSSDPMGFVQYGHILFYTPGLFGGSRDESISHYLSAEKKMLARGVEKDWNYMSLLTSIAESYHKMGEKSKALQYLDKALKAEPAFQWVKKELYPKYSK